MQDLQDLTEQAGAIADEIPESNEPLEGFPPQTSDMAELEAYAQRRGEEDLKLLEESGGPVIDFGSLEDMKAMAFSQSPQAIADKILEAARQKREEGKTANETGKTTQELSPEIAAENEFGSNLIQENLDQIHDLLYRAKGVLFCLQTDWREAEPFEKQLRLHAKAFKGNKQAGIDLLYRILTGEEKEEDLADKQPEAAFILATVANEPGRELEQLVACWEKDDTQAPFILQAFKYATNPFVITWIQATLKRQAPPIQAGLIEVLAFQRQVDAKQWDTLFTTSKPEVCTAIWHAFSAIDIRMAKDRTGFLLADPKANYAELALFAAMLAGDQEAVFTSRRRLMDAPDQAVWLPLFLACAGNEIDFKVMVHCLPEEKPRHAVISALGILGLPQAVPVLIDLITDKIDSKQTWDRQRHILDVLNLITGADLPLLFPEIKEGPAGKEYEVTVEIGWKNQWADWWSDHQHRFEPGVRYRRGLPFTLESCIAEMAYPLGNWWSRQNSYYELQIRSGRHIAPFFADWDVKWQLRAIEQWQTWWLENQHHYRFSQWFFNGKAV